MRAITETELRDLTKQGEFASYHLEEGCRLTPAAAQYLSERKIAVTGPGAGVANSGAHKLPAQGKPAAALEAAPSIYSAADFQGAKPEYMTHIKGDTLVLKSHPRILFRGKLDTFEALLINGVIEVESLGHQELGKDLREVLDYARQMLRAEVKEEPLAPISFHGWPPEEIRDRSHYPQKYYGVNHLLPGPGQGMITGKLNYLRTQARELELAGIMAFCQTPTQTEREDILQGLNRLSSLLYIMMIQLISGHYRVGI